MRSTEIGGEWFSVVGLGGYEFEDDPDWPGAREVLLAAIEAGIDWIDTAEEYYDRKNEPVIAAALRDVGQPMKLSSKVAPLPDGTGFEPKQIREACEGSLERLGVDRLDMYLMHYPGESNDGLEESWGAMRCARGRRADAPRRACRTSSDPRSSDASPSGPSTCSKKGCR